MVRPVTPEARRWIPKMKRRLRSQDWFGKQDKDGFIHRSWLKNQGYPDDMFDGRPVIGICNTWSELTPCNGHFRELAEFVKRGVYEAGGFPLEFPVMSLGETQLQAHRDVVPQSRQHGRRRIDSRQSHGRRGAAHGLRQDHAVAAHGRGELRSADHRHFRRPDVVGPLPRQADRLGHRRVADVRRRARREDERRKNSPPPNPACIARRVTA